MSERVELLIIDPQNDFCDLPPAWCPPDALSGRPLAPALPVSGAHADMRRLASFIRNCAQALDAITLTLDSHHRLDISHPTFWRRGDASAVTPFTEIRAAQVRAGEFLPRDRDALAPSLAYLDALEARGRYTLMVWPVHCEIGSWGHNVHAAVLGACGEWESQRLRAMQTVFKGTNPGTEHYSALEAEVPLAADPGTQLNRPLIAALDRADRLLVAGEASSHCVKATVEHLLAHLPSGRTDKLVLLTDCMSPVSGFGAQAEAFLADARARGATLATSTELAAQLAA
ncbi:MAG: cysteine hydrolase [Rhodocyclaceae bacterium]|nr:cysteine hydrolase [Rhodocyclaceae bacterium]